MSAGCGAKMASTPAVSSFFESDSKVRGYFARSSLGPNCVGLTKIDVTTWEHSRFARSTSAMWPAWSAPIVGTRPTILFSARARRAASFIQAKVRIVSTVEEFTGIYVCRTNSRTAQEKTNSPQRTRSSQRRNERIHGAQSCGGCYGAFAVEVHQVGEDGLSAELAQHRGDLAAMVGAVIDDVLERLRERIGIDAELHRFVFDDAVDVFLREAADEIEEIGGLGSPFCFE